MPHLSFASANMCSVFTCSENIHNWEERTADLPTSKSLSPHSFTSIVVLSMCSKILFPSTLLTIQYKFIASSILTLLLTPSCFNGAKRPSTPHACNSTYVNSIAIHVHNSFLIILCYSCHRNAISRNNTSVITVRPWQFLIEDGCLLPTLRIKKNCIRFRIIVLNSKMVVIDSTVSNLIIKFTEIWNDHR